MADVSEIGDSRIEDMSAGLLKNLTSPSTNYHALLSEARQHYTYSYHYPKESLNRRIFKEKE
jgi:hypothetical protein